MSKAKVTIELTATPTLNQFIAIQIDSNPTLIKEIAKKTRAEGTFMVGDPPLDISTITLNLAAAIGLDFEPGGLTASYPISVSIDASGAPTELVVIEAIEYGHSFTVNTEPSWATIVVTPEVPPVEVFAIDSITPTESDSVDKCTKARYDFVVSNAVYPIAITSPVVKVCNNAGELFFEHDRFPVPAVSLQATDNTASEASLLMPRVSTYLFDDDNITVIESFTGATATLVPEIENAGDIELSYTFSTDDITYGAGNVFHGLTPGSYTGYVLDNFGCKKSGLFTVVGVTVDKPDPICIIENANSLKFYEAQTEAFDGKTSFPNADNSSFIGEEQLYFNTEKRGYAQKFQQNDAPTTQIKSNYDNHAINVRKFTTVENYLSSLDDSLLPLSAGKVGDNILQDDKRDCKIIGGGTGKTLIYFPGGNIYIPDTTTVDRPYSNPQLLLPPFLDDGTIASGVKVTLSGNAVLNGTFDVEGDIQFEDDGTTGRAIKISANYTGDVGGTTVIAQSLYNALDYNIWEFTASFETYEDGCYYIDMIATDDDPRYDTRTWRSEPILIKSEVWKETTYIEYTSTKNFSQIDYSTGIKNMLRIPARFVKYRNGGEKDSFEDSQGRSITTKEVITRDIAVETSLMPQYVLEKFNLAIGHDTIKINGMSGAFPEKSEDEDRFEDNNRMYNSVAVFRLNETTTISDTSGLVSQVGMVLGVGTGNFVLSVDY